MFKRITSLILIGLLSIPTFATEDIQDTAQSIQEIIDSNINIAKVDSSVMFDLNEYVRITQPIVDEQEYEITTFERQINMMGEARAGTQIVITVLRDNFEHQKYELELVGATQTFNQLIELGERQNLIIVSYKHNDYENTFAFEIFRQPEENKSQLKNFIISTPNDLPESLNEKQHF